MATFNFTVFETDSDYYNSGTGQVGNASLLTINDEDGLLHQNTGADPGGDQTFAFAAELAVTNYDVTYLDNAQVNGAGPEFELFAMTVTFVGGGTKYYVLAKDALFAPSNGDTLAITSFDSFTNTPYGEIQSAVCFTQGALIGTPFGVRSIETLKKGDLVQTVDNGAKPILWIGSRLLNEATLRARPNLRPILIKPGVLGRSGSPILLSPQHRVHLKLREGGGSERLIRAKHLAEYAPSLARVAHGKKTVRYFHILLDQHELIFANGYKSESLMPSGMALRGLSWGDRREIALIFPELAVGGRRLPKSFTALARPLVPRHQASKLDYCGDLQLSA